MWLLLFFCAFTLLNSLSTMPLLNHCWVPCASSKKCTAETLQKAPAVAMHPVNQRMQIADSSALLKFYSPWMGSVTARHFGLSATTWTPDVKFSCGLSSFSLVHSLTHTQRVHSLLSSSLFQVRTEQGTMLRLADVGKNVSAAFPFIGSLAAKHFSSTAPELRPHLSTLAHLSTI